MPQDPQDKLTSLLMNRPAPADQSVQLPAGEGDDPLGNKIIRGVTTGLGLEDQKPGDAAGAIGQAISLFGPGIAKMRGAKLAENFEKSGAPQHLVDAVKFAQQRWPRLFGHIDNLSVTTGDTARGSSGMSATKLTPEGNRIGSTSNIMLNPDRLANKYDAANTLGHEMLHAADRVVQPDFDAFANYSLKLPGQYSSASPEIRARLQGARTQGYMEGANRSELTPYASPLTTKTRNAGPNDVPVVPPDPGSDRTIRNIQAEISNSTHPAMMEIVNNAGKQVIDAANKRGWLKDAAMPEIDSRISGIPPKPTVPAGTFNEDPQDKLYRIIRDRQQNPTPRVPATPQPHPQGYTTPLDQDRQDILSAKPQIIGQPMGSGRPVFNDSLANDLMDVENGKLSMDDFIDRANLKIGPRAFGDMLKIGTPTGKYFDDLFYKLNYPELFQKK